MLQKIIRISLLFVAFHLAACLDDAGDGHLSTSSSGAAPDIEEPELMEEPARDPHAPICVVFVPSAEERDANPHIELESNCYESRAAMEGSSRWLNNPHANQLSTLYYLGEGFEHIDLGGATYVFVSSKRCGAGTPNPDLSSLPEGWNDRLSSYAYFPGGGRIFFRTLAAPESGSTSTPTSMEGPRTLALASTRTTSALWVGS